MTDTIPHTAERAGRFDPHELNLIEIGEERATGDMLRLAVRHLMDVCDAAGYWRIGDGCGGGLWELIAEEAVARGHETYEMRRARYKAEQAAKKAARQAKASS